MPVWPHHDPQCSECVSAAPPMAAAGVVFALWPDDSGRPHVLLAGPDLPAVARAEPESPTFFRRISDGAYSALARDPHAPRGRTALGGRPGLVRRSSAQDCSS